MLGSRRVIGQNPQHTHTRGRLDPISGRQGWVHSRGAGAERAKLRSGKKCEFRHELSSFRFLSLRGI